MLLRLNEEVNKEEGAQEEERGNEEKKKKSYWPRVISRFASAITKSHLNANKLDGPKKTGLKRLNLQIIPLIKQERGPTRDTLNKEAHTQNTSNDCRRDVVSFLTLVVSSWSEKCL